MRSLAKTCRKSTFSHLINYSNSALKQLLVLLGEPKQPKDLSSLNCLLYSLLSAKEDWGFATGIEAGDIGVDGSLSTNNGDVLKEAAIQGLGIVLMPTFIVEDALADGRLKTILHDYCPLPFNLYAVRPSRQFTPERVRILIEFLREHIGEKNLIRTKHI